jgi:pyruvate/2-oxoglutarate dehydrogenase complex dihydrolipoamide dehydrogenase (E3) component
MEKYKAIIIGSGQGGTPLARRLAQAGWKTMLIEKRWIGGTCVNDGCTPTKAMIASAQLNYKVSHAMEWGVEVKESILHAEKVVSRKDEIVQSFRRGSQQRLEKQENLTVIFGEASFSGEKQITVSLHDGSVKAYSAEYVFINTGGRPAVPSLKGIHDIPFLTSTTLLDVKKIPEHLFIVGGGYVALEFGQMYRRFGSEITIIEHHDRLLPKEDADIAASVQDVLEKEGISIYTKSNVKAFTGSENQIKVLTEVNGDERTFDCSHVLMATGRTPNTEALHLSASKISVDEKGYIKVDDRLQTTCPGVYALGDVKGGPAFTHISYHDYVILAKNLLQGADERTTARMVPYCMYTDPQLGRIGVTEQEARARGMDIQIAKMPMSYVARAIETGDTRGLMKAVIHKDSQKILGVAIHGAEGGEVMSLLQMAMMGNLPYPLLRDAIFAHPSYAEALNNLFADVS